MGDDIVVIAGGPGGAARARTGRNDAIPQDRTVRVFDSIVQPLLPFPPIKAHIIIGGEGVPAGVRWVRYCYLTGTSGSQPPPRPTLLVKSPLNRAPSGVTRDGVR